MATARLRAGVPDAAARRPTLTGGPGSTHTPRRTAAADAVRAPTHPPDIDDVGLVLIEPCVSLELVEERHALELVEERHAPFMTSTASTTAANIDAASAANRALKQTTTSMSTMVSRRPLMFEEAIEPAVQGMSEEQRFLLDMQGCKRAHVFELQ